MPGGCPDVEMLAAYVDGNLTSEERTVVEAHLTECRDYRRIVTVAVKIETYSCRKP